MQISINAAGGGGGFGGGGFNATSLQLNLVAADYNTLLDRNNAVIQQIQANPYVSDVTSSLSQLNIENDFIPDRIENEGHRISVTRSRMSLTDLHHGAASLKRHHRGLSYPIQVLADPTTIAGWPVAAHDADRFPEHGRGAADRPARQVRASGGARELEQGQPPVYRQADNQPQAERSDRTDNVQNQITNDLTKSGLIGGDVSLTVGGGRFSSDEPCLRSLATTVPHHLSARPLPRLPRHGGAVQLMAVSRSTSSCPCPSRWSAPCWSSTSGGGPDIFGLMGMLMLIGLSAKNAILYLDFVVERIGKMPFKEALIEAAKLASGPSS